MESLGLKKSPVAFISRVSFRGGEENKIKRREKVFPLLLISNKGKANERSRGNRDWNNYSIIKLRGNLRNDLWKWNRPRFGKSPRHQLNQEGLLFNYLGWRVGLVSPPCASVPDILSAAINERERKKKNPASVEMGTCRKSGIELSIESGNQSIKIICFRLEASLFENRLIT